MGGLDEGRPTPPAGAGSGSTSLTGRQIGRYLVGQRLGSGGVADVYQAYDQVLGRSVALKLLPSGADERTLNRFRREAMTAGALRHPHIVRILQVGSAQPEGLAYIAMELVQGESLATFLGRRGQLNPAESCNLLEPIARALAHAHRAGVVHRDVKPANILLQPASPGAPNSVQLESLDHPVVPLLTDFGIARALDAPELTSAGRTVGTPAYMAPEQCAGSGEIDGRADIYALGAVLYRCIAGRLPFNGSTTQILYAHVYEPLVIEDQVLQFLSPLMVDILKQSMAKRPQDRFADADLMAAALAFAAGRRQVASRDSADQPVGPGTATATLTVGSLSAAGSAAARSAAASSAASASAATTVLVAPANRQRPGVAAAPPYPVPAGSQAPSGPPVRRRRLSLLMAAATVVALTVLVAGFVLVAPLASRFGGAPPTPTGAILAVAATPTITGGATAVALLAGPTPSATPTGASTGASTGAPSTTPTGVPTSTPTVTQTPVPSPTATWTPIPTATATWTPAPTEPPTSTPTATASPPPAATLPPDEELVTACASTVHEFFAGAIAQLAAEQRLGVDCPDSTATRTSGTILPFERGFMVQLATDPLILVHYAETGEWEQLVAPGGLDDWEGEAPPDTDFFVPRGSFGQVWQDDRRRAALGYAVNPDVLPFDAVQQVFPGGLLIGNLDGGAVYVFLRDRLRL